MSQTYGDYLANHQNVSAAAAYASGATGAVSFIAVSGASYQICVQRITISVTVDAAQTLTFRDSNGTPVIVAVCPASPGLGYKLLADFGPKGFGLTAGKNLDVTGTAGLAGILSVEAYQKNTSPVAN